jgi:hypothetical protein
MPKGPKGEKRPADVIGNAAKVMRIATGEEDEALTADGKDKAALERFAFLQNHAVISFSPRGEGAHLAR